MKRKISIENLNALVANSKIDEAIVKSGEHTEEKSVYLAKVILKDSPTHKLKTNVPIIAFVKHAGNKLAIKVLTGGLVVVLEDKHIATVSEVQGDFSIGGVVYGLKDTVNGFPRYKVKRV